MLIWITGISGSGKSTIASALYEKLHSSISNIVYFDGDEFRQAMGNDLGYSLEDRDKNAVRLTGISQLLCRQGIHVVCGANLTSQRYRDFCRAEIPGYFEVYINVPIDTLSRRDKKGLYVPARKGECSKVVGVDIAFQPPLTPDLVIDNSADRTDFSDILELIITRSGIGKILKNLTKPHD